ncbi:MAG: hypothetical protein JXN63_02170 [Candidatus Delongbacteria bacterium]|nr:hypothetical protein [Candidatus Delongbacteria bacterium]
MRNLFLIPAAVLFLFLSGCTALRVTAVRYDIENVDLEIIQNALEKNYSDISSVSGRFDFSYSTEKDRMQSSGYIFTAGRDTLYLEIKGLAGTTEAVVFIDSDSLKAVNYSEKLRIFEKSTENSLQRITGIGYTAADIIKMFSVYPGNGRLINIDKKDPEEITVRHIADERDHSFIKLDERLLVKSVEEYTERDIRATKEYDYYTNENGIFYPRRIRIRTYDPPAKLTVFFTRIAINEKKVIEVPYE